MFLIPYRLEQISRAPFPMWRALVFLTRGGTEVWQTDPEDAEASVETIVQQYFRANELEGCVRGIHGGALFYEVSEATNLNSFYTWQESLQATKEPDQSVELWRPLFWMGSQPGEPDEYDWLPCTKEICLGSFGSCDRFWMVLRELAKEK